MPTMAKMQSGRSMIYWSIQRWAVYRGIFVNEKKWDVSTGLVERTEIQKQ